MLSNYFSAWTAARDLVTWSFQSSSECTIAIRPLRAMTWLVRLLRVPTDPAAQANTDPNIHTTDIAITTNNREKPRT